MLWLFTQGKTLKTKRMRLVTDHYPTGLPPARLFVPGCHYRATDAHQIAGEEIFRNRRAGDGLLWLTSIAGRRSVHRAMAPDDRRARMLLAGSFHFKQDRSEPLDHPQRRRAGRPGDVMHCD